MTRSDMFHILNYTAAGVNLLIKLGTKKKNERFVRPNSLAHFKENKLSVSLSV